MNLVDRLKLFMEHVGMPSTQFADEAKIARPTISQILNGRNRKISNEVLEKLHTAFPDLNIMWLLFGDGDMVKSSNTPFSRPQNSQNLFSNIEQRPVEEEVAQASHPTHSAHVPLQSSNIESFVEENRQNNCQKTENPNPQTAIHQIAAPNRDLQKRIQSIMVFYTDSSFEIFTPSV